PTAGPSRLRCRGPRSAGPRAVAPHRALSPSPRPRVGRAVSPLLRHGAPLRRGRAWLNRLVLVPRDVVRVPVARRGQGAAAGGQGAGWVVLPGPPAGADPDRGAAAAPDMRPARRTRS